MNVKHKITKKTALTAAIITFVIIILLLPFALTHAQTFTPDSCITIEINAEEVQFCATYTDTDWCLEQWASSTSCVYYHAVDFDGTQTDSNTYNYITDTTTGQGTAYDEEIFAFLSNPFSIGDQPLEIEEGTIDFSMVYNGSYNRFIFYQNANGTIVNLTEAGQQLTITNPVITTLDIGNTITSSVLIGILIIFLMVYVVRK